MASFRSSLLAEIRNNYSIATICRKVNSLVYESVRAGSFVSAVYGVLDSKNHIFTFSNCGHNLPIHIKSNGQVDYLKEGGQVMGVSPDVAYEQRPVVINIADVIVYYTDGVTEVFNNDGVEFGMDRLIAVVKENQNRPAYEILNKIVESVRSFASTKHVFDDITAIVLKRSG
jgi:sigma-B regulation protein RsbU (phosphoserine phosphatase)